MKKKKKAERSHYQPTHNRRNVKESPSHGRKMTDGNTALLKDIKNTRNGSYII